jgi:hypothetical protein
MSQIKCILSLVLAVSLLSACAHVPDKVENPPPNPGLSRILQRGELIVGTTGKQPPLNPPRPERPWIGCPSPEKEKIPKVQGRPQGISDIITISLIV